MGKRKSRRAIAGINPNMTATEAAAIGARQVTATKAARKARFRAFRKADFAMRVEVAG